MKSNEAETSSDTAIYQPLDPAKRQIRVLELHPGTGEGQIIATLHVTSLPARVDLLSPDFVVEELKGVLGEVLALTVQAYRGTIESRNYAGRVRSQIAIQLRLVEQTAGRQSLPVIARAAYGFLRIIASWSDWMVDENAKPGLYSLWHHLRRDQQREASCVDSDSPSERVDEFVKYEAVSYCWTNVMGRSTITLNGIATSIPASAAEVLVSFRYPDVSRWLWIDALCIDQGDKDERAEQVSIMDQVYINATNTLVWLGTERANTMAAVQLCRDIAYQFTCGRDDSNFASFAAIDPVCEKIKVPDRSTVSLLEDIFTRRWFDRVWVFQEVMLSKNCVCYIGDQRIPWPHIEFISRWLLNSRTSNPDLTNGQLSSATLARATKIPSLSLLSRLEPAFQGGYSLHSLAMFTSRLEATEPMDRVFGLLSLTRWAKAGRDLPLAIRPDYRKPLRDCMRDATRTMIEEEQDLLALGVVGTRELPQQEKDERPWPSWTPAWCGKENQGVNGFLATYRAHNDRPSTLQPLSLGDKSDCLCLEGFVVDRVNMVDQVAIWSHTADLPSLQGTIQYLKQSYHNGEGRQDGSTKILSFLTADRERDRPFIRANCASIKALVSGQALPADASTSTKTTFQRQTYGGIFSLASNLTESQKMEDLRYDIQHTLTGRRFFRTLNGKKGLGPKELEQSDIIAVLFGGCWPFALRKEEEHYRLLGACYVEDIMDGEVVRECTRRKVRPETFEIF